MYLDPRQARLFFFFAGLVSAIFAPLYGLARIHFGLPHMWPWWFYLIVGPILGAYCFWRWWNLCDEDE